MIAETTNSTGTGRGTKYLDIDIYTEQEHVLLKNIIKKLNYKELISFNPRIVKNKYPVFYRFNSKARHFDFTFDVTEVYAINKDKQMSIWKIIKLLNEH